MRTVVVLLALAVGLLWIRVMVLEDNMFKFNNAVKTLAGGLMEVRNGL